MKILAIHGAFSTPYVFNYIQHKLDNYTFDHFSYQDKYKNVSTVIEDCNTKITHDNEDVIILGHSLGGVIGANLLSNKKVKGLVTLASPVGGIKMNFYASNFLFKRTFIQEITPFSPVIVSCKDNIELTKKPVYNIITTSGFSPFMNNENDGVVTIESQLIKHSKQIYVAANHHEILQHPQTILELAKIFPKIKK